MCIRDRAYTDSQLKSIEDILTGSIETSKARYDSLISSLQQFEDVVAANRAELFPPCLLYTSKSVAECVDKLAVHLVLFAFFGVLKLLHLQGIFPVSYTHLDVYKRQCHGFFICLHCI